MSGVSSALPEAGETTQPAPEMEAGTVFQPRLYCD